MFFLREKTVMVVLQRGNAVVESRYSAEISRLAAMLV